MLTVHEPKANKTEEQKEDFIASIMAEQDFTEELVRLARTVTLNLLSETLVLVAKKRERH